MRMFPIKKYIVAVFLISSCCFASLKDYVFETEEDLNNFIMKLGFKSYVAYKLNQKNCADWIKEGKYQDSIYNVISAAISDCCMERNEFAEDKLQDDVVTFENKNYRNYKPEHWNAVVLYNLVYFVMVTESPQDSNLDSEEYIDIFYKKYIEDGKLKSVCGGEHDQKIRNAFNDIREYDKNLNIVQYILGDDNIFDHVNKRVCTGFSTNGLARIEIINDNCHIPLSYKSEGKTIKTGANMNIYIEGGKVARACIYENRKYGECDLDEYMNITYTGEMQEYKYPKVKAGTGDEIKRGIDDVLGRSEGPQLAPGDTENLHDINTKKLFDVIDVGSYKDIDGNIHLAWLDIDRCYLDKAYYSRTSFDTIATIILDKSLGDLWLDKNCFCNLTITNNINDKNYVYTIAISQSTNKLVMPEDCSFLISNSNSIIAIDLDRADFSKTVTAQNMIAGNDGITNISIGGEIDKTSAIAITDVIKDNSLLRYVDLHFYNIPKYLHYSIGDMIVSCEQLKEVNYYFPDATNDELDKLSYFHKQEWAFGHCDSERKLYIGCAVDDKITVNFYNIPTTPYISFTRTPSEAIMLIKYGRQEDLSFAHMNDNEDTGDKEENEEQLEPEEKQDENNKAREN